MNSPDTSNIEQRLAAIEARLNGRQLADKPHSTSAIGAVLHQRRLAYGLPMHAVKARGGPSIAFQSAIENGKQTVVSVPVLIRWCAAIGCDPVEVFSDIIQTQKET
jgi:hypothetical protein